MSVSVNLTGPAPWGFRITGGRDFRKPIIVIEHGKAALGDLRPGDVIISINGESTSEMLNVEAQNKIKQSPGQYSHISKKSPFSTSDFAPNVQVTVSWRKKLSQEQSFSGGNSV
uniref:PDZ domain-containing protein n=1 Tax=Laticauda laticaudata TaxID=8630 RepID=A0A8C5SWS8_LATLA